MGKKFDDFSSINGFIEMPSSAHLGLRAAVEHGLQATLGYGVLISAVIGLARLIYW